MSSEKEKRGQELLDELVAVSTKSPATKKTAAKKTRKKRKKRAKKTPPSLEPLIPESPTGLIIAEEQLNPPKKKRKRGRRGPELDKRLVDLEPETLSKEVADAILHEYSRRFGATEFQFPHLEDLIDKEEGFGISKFGGLSPLQRAICRIVEGVPLEELAVHPHVAEALGITPDEVEEWELRRASEGFKIPDEVFVIAGIRTFKSLLVAAAGIWASQKVDVSNLGSGEIPRYSIVSLTVDNAKVVLMHLLGALRKPALAGLVVEQKDLEKRSDWKEIIRESSADLVGSKFLWHPSGVPIEIRVVAGKRAGGSTVSRWSAGVGLDEAPRMVGADQGVVNYTDIRRSVMGRLLPGAQLFSVGSPWVNEGPVFDIFSEWWGQPRLDRVIFKSPGPLLNPVWWTPARCEKLKKQDEIAYQMDVLAEFADAGEALFPQVLIAACTRRDRFVIDPEPYHEYSAAMDPATRNNAWTLAISDRVRFTSMEEDENGQMKPVQRTKKRVVYAHQWQGSQVTPLSPRVVLGEISDVLRKYGLDFIYTDMHHADSMRDIAMEFGLVTVAEHWTSDEAVNHYLGLRYLMGVGEFEIPDDPQIAKDFRLVRRQVTRKGPTIHLSTTADGRHCDYAPAILRSISRWIRHDRDAPPAPGTPEAHEAELEKWRQKAFAKVRRSIQEKKNPFTYDAVGERLNDSLGDLLGLQGEEL